MLIPMIIFLPNTKHMQRMLNLIKYHELGIGVKLKPGVKFFFEELIKQ